MDCLTIETHGTVGRVKGVSDDKVGPSVLPMELVSESQ